LGGDGLAGFRFGDDLLVKLQGGVNIALRFLGVEALLQQSEGEAAVAIWAVARILVSASKRSATLILRA